MRHLNGFRLAIVTDTWAPQLNGVTRTLSRLVREAASRGVDIRVYTAEDPAARSDPRVTSYPSRSFALYPQLRMAWPGGRAMSHAWESWRPDLVHAATPFGLGLAARSAARQLRIPFVTSYHTSLNAYAEFYRLGWLSRPGWSFLRWFHNSGLRTWCPTLAIASDLAARGFADTALWGRGVDPVAFNPGFRSLAFRREHGIADHEVLVAYVGRLAREKGLEPLVVAMHSAIARSMVPMRLILVGDGPFEGAARALAPAGTVFTGTLTGHALSTAFASADIFAFPSTTDTFGNVVLEAMASGVPVLAADCAVTREVLGADGGFYFDPGQQPSDHLVRLAADPEARQHASRVATQRAAGRSWDAVFGRLFTEYLELARMGHPSATPAGSTSRLVGSPDFVAQP
jgi:glycosyltransferase involved in cell wall biosynthesis